MTDMTAYFAQLVGCRITAFRLEQDECGGAPWPIFTMTTPDGTTLDMCLSCDPEGNDGGFAFITSLEKAEAN